jgi:hypothetical protein
VTILSLPTSELHHLLAPVIPHAGTDLDLPQLSAIRLELTGDILYAAATDRSTLAATRQPLAEPMPEAAVTLDRDGAQAILRVFKHTRDENPVLRLDIATGGLRVDGEDGTRLVLEAHGTIFPEWRRLLGQYLHRGHAGVHGVMLAGHLVGRWSKACRKGDRLQVMFGTDPTDPVLVTVGEHFAGIWMPAAELEATRTDWLADNPWLDEVRRPDPSAELDEVVRKLADDGITVEVKLDDGPPPNVAPKTGEIRDEDQS